ncbi:MAG: NAD-glutamate dehydrogenase [Archangium sp.]|nr:NAD-glutamate dehydrogenase [Archangium sp.]
MKKTAEDAGDSKQWLNTAMPPGFFAAMRDEPEALAILSRELMTLRHNQHLVLADRPTALIMANRNTPGSLYEALTLRAGPVRAISYAMFAHSEACIPGLKETLEIQRFEFDCKPDAEIAQGLAGEVKVPEAVRAPIWAEVKKSFEGFGEKAFDRLLAVFWLNNPNHTKNALPRRLAQRLHSLFRCEQTGGLSLELEPIEEHENETRVSFAVASPPQKGFLAQMMEVFNRLDLGITGASVLQVSTGIQHYAVNTFYVRPRNGERLVQGSALDTQLRRELFNTQILDANSPEYQHGVAKGRMSGEDASLVRAFVAFCHTNLGHGQPDRFDWDEVQSAFQANPQLVQQLVQLFRTRFTPGLKNREKVYAAALESAAHAVKNFNTGHKHLDDLRRTIFGCCLVFIRHTLKTNFFVNKKQAFAFRLSPAYLADLGPEFTSDLPAATPFRVTFFFTRDGFGYHIGFSDIARGGWRTVICRTDDDFLTNAATLFRENFVLAHTQHLKNKDIYEGGSKLVMLMDASTLEARDQETRYLYNLQRAVIHAFLDLYVTKDGVASNPSVVDYYREDEPIELGPDENMHDVMIEEIAQISRDRGYILGIGVMSSKHVGINHKEYAVTSTGLVTFTEITLKQLGINIRKDPFSVKFTGGPNGDVAGNAMNLMLARCPKMAITLILDGTAALVDPKGANHKALANIVLKKDLDGFDPKALHVGGFMLFRTGNRKAGLKEQYRRVTQTPSGLKEEWISVDDFSRQFGELIFSVKADVFIPGGGRPETIDKDNWQRFLLADGTPSSRAIVEGANSFITPAARLELQKKGVIVMRDASANKCGVISSSYEIIANLVLSEQEFLANKKRYVKGVLEILERRASDEANLIFRRHQETGRPFTEISDGISVEINNNYARLFKFFQARPELALKKPWRKAIMSHLPTILREDARFNDRLPRLPQKYRSAILAAEIGSSMVYRGDRDSDFEDTVRLHVERTFPD